MVMTLTVISNLDKAKALIQEASLSQAIEIISETDALRVYAKQASKGLEIQNQCAEIKIRAERRAGELLAIMEKNKGAATQSQPGTALPPRIEDLGITKNDSSRWQLEASIPEERFQKIVDDINADPKKELTSTIIRVEGKKISQEDKNEAKREELNQQRVSLASITPPSGKYRTIIIDPGWPMDKSERTARPLQGGLGRRLFFRAREKR